MMRIVSCLGTFHNPWLVLLAACVCVAGGWVGLRLFGLARKREGAQKLGWIFLAAVAIGGSIWCTHFIAMLAYQVAAPVTFEPVLTMLSLFVVIIGTATALMTASGTGQKYLVGGALLGLSISGMHYAGMMAYRVAGFVSWDLTYVAVSVILGVAFGMASLFAAGRDRSYAALGAFVLAVVSMHFTGMTAVSVDPFVGAQAGTPASTVVAIAVAVAGMALLIIGTGVASYIIDSDSAERSVEQLRHMAMNDPLTGLPNRASFATYLETEVQRAEVDGFRIGVLGIDLDKFKEINDLRGHDVGDQTLKIIAARLSDVLRSGEFVARIGGDEFAAVKRFKENGDLNDFVNRIDEELSAPIHAGDLEIVTGGSIGVSVFPQDADSVARLISNADLAMYRAKADITRTICYYEVGMDEAARSRRKLGLELRKAIGNNELELHYQVQESVHRRGETVGYEVLLRWRHPVRGFVSPAEFIPLAEETGAIIEIGEWVLRTACKEALQWPSGAKIAVNISAIQLVHVDLPKLVHEILIETGFPASRLELEITETSIISDKERSLHALRRIKALGVTVAIDDFGTGYSSLDTLRSFPFDRIKLDRSFMHEVETSPQARAIVRAVLALGHSLDISVLAEGVETETQLAVLRREGCHEAQGFLLGRPKRIAFQDQATMSVAPGQKAPALLPTIVGLGNTKAA